MLTKQQAYDKELKDSEWIVAIIKAELSSQLEASPYLRRFLVSIKSVEKVPSKPKVLGTYKFVEEWLTSHGWGLIEYNCPEYGVLEIGIE